MAYFALPLMLAGLALHSASEIAPGDELPLLTGEYLTGKRAALPDAAKGRIALLLMGFTYESRFPVEAWSARFRKEFGTDQRVTFYEIPMIGGLARLGGWFIDAGMRRGTPPSDYEHVITVYGGTKSWKEKVGFNAPDAAYLILLDRMAKVAWRYAGPFDDGAYRALALKTSELLSAE